MKKVKCKENSVVLSFRGPGTRKRRCSETHGLAVESSVGYWLPHRCTRRCQGGPSRFEDGMASVLRVPSTFRLTPARNPFTFANVDFGATVRRLRESQSMSRSELCKASIRPDTGRPISRAMVLLIETGQRGKQPSFSIAAALAVGLGVDLDYLLSEAKVNVEGPEKIRVVRE